MIPNPRSCKTARRAGTNVVKVTRRSPKKALTARGQRRLKEDYPYPVKIGYSEANPQRLKKLEQQEIPAQRDSYPAKIGYSPVAMKMTQPQLRQFPENMIHHVGDIPPPTAGTVKRFGKIGLRTLQQQKRERGTTHHNFLYNDNRELITAGGPRMVPPDPNCSQWYDASYSSIGGPQTPCQLQREVVLTEDGPQHLDSIASPRRGRQINLQRPRVTQKISRPQGLAPRLLQHANTTSGTVYLKRKKNEVTGKCYERPARFLADINPYRQFDDLTFKITGSGEHASSVVNMTMRPIQPPRI